MNTALSIENTDTNDQFRILLLGVNGLLAFQSKAAERKWRVLSVQQFIATKNASHVDAVTQLRQIKGTGARVIILNCFAEQGLVVLEQAEREGMMAEGWMWIGTDGITGTVSIKRASDVGLSTRRSWVRIPATARHGIYEQDTLQSTVRGSHNKQNCLRHPNLSLKKTNEVAYGKRFVHEIYVDFDTKSKILSSILIGPGQDSDHERRLAVVMTTFWNLKHLFLSE
jgi:hypothetical protein